MKRLDLFFLGVLVPLDYLAIVLAALAAYSLRFGPFASVFATTVTISSADFAGSVALFALAFVAIFALAGLYAPRVRRRMAAEFPRIILASSTGIAFVIVTIFFQREYFASRFIVLAAWAFAMIFVFSFRTLLRFIRYFLSRSGIGITRLALVGQSVAGSAIEATYLMQYRWTSKIVAHFPRWDEKTRTELAAMRERGLVDGLVIADPTFPRDKILSIQTFVDNNHLGFRYVADLLGTERASIETTMVGGVPVVEVRRTALEGWGAIAKRVFDLLIAGLLIIILSPVMLVIALAIKTNSKGPVIYKNERVGYKGRTFKLYKFRSMLAELSTGAEFGGEKALELEKKLIEENSIKEGPVYKIKNDPRVTSVGRFIRETSLDELPQLFNVMNGTMSLVGPRPHQPREVEKYESHEKRVLAVRPGITGLAQISGRSEIPFADEARLDNFYIEHWSLITDLIILIKTPFAVVGRKGAL
jgi:exopolysaccharide biosynthesis polyprenyl glycosylphosphotransferase